MGTFVSLDLIVFFVFFEIVLIPMWFVIADWGDEQDPVGRRRAASRFLVVTVIGSALMLVGFLMLHRRDRLLRPDRDHRPTRRHQPSTSRCVIAVLLMVGFGAKVPMWPLHFWLPDAHSKAPTIGSVLLAGVLLKLGTYGLLRFWYSTCPTARSMSRRGSAPSAWSGIIYGSLACLAQTDLKRLIAYSSIGHMGFVRARDLDPHPAGCGRCELRQRRARRDHRPAVLLGRRGEGAGRQGPVSPRSGAGSTAARRTSPVSSG